MNKINPSQTLALLCLLVGIPMCQPYGENVTHMSYDPSTEVCCNDKLFDIKTGTQCCGDTVIDPSTHQCCSGFSQLIKAGYECCNNVLYNIATEKCCYDFVDRANQVVKPDGDKYLCCNGRLFDDEHQICCNGVVAKNEEYTHQCCDNKLINMKDSICCYNDTHDEIIMKRNSPSDVCYYDVTINPEKQLWCDNVVVENPTGNLECCGKETFDKSKGFLCCQTLNSTKIVSKLEADHDYCCGETTYNSAKGVCCEKGNEVKYHSFEDGRPTPYCCGSGIFYPDTHENCCVDKIYIDTKQTCCSDYDGEYFRSKIINSVDATCCGINTYDPKTHICCGSTVLAKPGANDIHSCCMYYEKY